MSEAFCKCLVHRSETVDQTAHQQKMKEIYETSKQLTVVVPHQVSTDTFEKCECSTEGVETPKIDTLIVEVWSETVITPRHGEAPKHPLHLGDEDYSRQLEEGYGES